MIVWRDKGEEKAPREARMNGEQMGGRLINSGRKRDQRFVEEVLKAVDDAAFPQTDTCYAKVAAEAKKKHKPARKARL